MTGHWSARSREVTVFDRADGFHGSGQGACSDAGVKRKGDRRAQ